MVEYKVGPRGYDGGLHNSPFAEGRIKEPFTAPGTFNPFMFMKPRRRRLNLLSIVQVLSIPSVVFAMTTYLFGFSVHNSAPSWCWFFVAFCLAITALFLFKAFLNYRKQRQERWSVPWYLLNDDDTWFLYLGVSVGCSCILGCVVGLIIYSGYTEGYYTLSLLHTYENVDPVAEGKAYLDAGVVDFKKDTFVDTTHAIGYKDGNVYCVAPIKLGTDATVNQDFWAVGVNCCTGFPGSFNCFENRGMTNGIAHGGLRVIDDVDIPFFKLAVMQADGEFKENSGLLKDGRMNSVNPLFFTYMKDPSKTVKSMWNDAVWTYFVSLAAFLAFEMAALGWVAYVYWKNRLWG